MPIVDPDKGSEVSPDCTWGECALFELATSRTVRLERNGQAEQWLLVRGKAELNCQGTSREASGPMALPVDAGQHCLVTASEELVLLRYHPAAAPGN